MSKDVAAHEKWPGWIKTAIANWNAVSAQTGWTFVECPADKRLADFDFQFFKPEGYDDKLKDRANLQHPTITASQTGVPVNGAESVESVKIVRDIQQFTTNGVVVDGGWVGWETTDGPRGQKRLDPVLVIMHELTHVMLLDHGTEQCGGVDFEEPVCAGDHKVRPPSVSDINEIRLAGGLNPFPTVPLPGLPDKGCFTTQADKDAFIKDLKAQIEKLQADLDEAKQDMPKNVNVNNLREFQELTKFQRRIKYDEVNLDAVKAFLKKAEGTDVCKSTMRTVTGPPGGTPSYVGLPSAPSNGPSWFVGTGLGFIPVRSTYDDGFTVDGMYALLGLNGGARIPIGNQAFVGIQAEVGGSVGTATKQFAATQLPWFATAEAQIGAVTQLAALAPLTVYGGLGGAVAGIRVGSSAPGSSWSDTQTVGGFTASIGAESPIANNLKAFTQARYLYFPFHTFNSPGSSFQLKDSAVVWSAGIRMELQ